MVIYTIRVFTAEGCPHSRALCDDLRRRGVRFLEINLTQDPRRLEELHTYCWEHRVPVVVDHERVSIGFRGMSSTFEEVGLDG